MLLSLLITASYSNEYQIVDYTKTTGAVLKAQGIPGIYSNQVENILPLRETTLFVTNVWDDHVGKVDAATLATLLKVDEIYGALRGMAQVLTTIYFVVFDENSKYYAVSSADLTFSSSAVNGAGPLSVKAIFIPDTIILLMLGHSSSTIHLEKYTKTAISCVGDCYACNGT